MGRRRFMKRNYIGFARMGSTFGPAEGAGDYNPTLPAGHYKVDYVDYEDRLVLTTFTPKMDEILNLGCKEFNDVLRNLGNFLSPEAAEKFKKEGYLLKRSFLFHGPPGTGKSVLATKSAQLAINTKNAIAIYPSSYDALERMLEVLGETDKERFTVISLEEVDDLISGRDESSWTSLLDGQFQSANRLLLATTNNVQEIPQRLLRPGRFSSLVYIPPLNNDARFKYLVSKGLEEAFAASIVNKTNTFTVDELKEVVQNAYILGEPLDEVILAINQARTLGKGGLLVDNNGQLAQSTNVMPTGTQIYVD